MKFYKWNLCCLPLVVLSLSCRHSGDQAANTAASFKPTWSSLKEHDTPNWLLDAKFGIYCHWGLTLVRNLDGNQDRHLRELIPQFRAENFNAAEWTELFQTAGAKFAGPVAWHGSGYLHWDSDLTPWNSIDMGPGIDIDGELEKEIRARDMKFMTSFHQVYWYLFPHWSGDPEYIYGTIPWGVYGEGPTRLAMSGHYSEGQSRTDYTAGDYRFTDRDNIIYAICLDWPGEKAVIHALGSRGKLFPDEIFDIEMIGSDEKLEWKQTGDALTIRMPVEKPCDHAYVFKIYRIM